MSRESPNICQLFINQIDILQPVKYALLQNPSNIELAYKYALRTAIAYKTILLYANQSNTVYDIHNDTVLNIDTPYIINKLHTDVWIDFQENVPYTYVIYMKHQKIQAFDYYIQLHAIIDQETIKTIRLQFGNICLLTIQN